MKNNIFLSNAIYKKFITHFPICAVDVIFLNKSKNKVLLFKRKNRPLKNIYYSPGGRLLKNEDFYRAACRKTKEELGINLNSKKLIWGGIMNEIHSNSIYKDVNYHCVDIYFGYILNFKNIEIKLDKQHSAYKWFDISDKNLHPNIKQKIKNLLFK